MKFCSIVTYHSLPHALVLADAVARHHGGARLVILPIDPRAREPALASGRVEIVDMGDLALPAAERVIGSHGWADAAEILKPWLLRRLLNDGAEVAVQLDPDCDLLSHLDDLRSAVTRGGVLLVPRTLQTLPGDGLEPSDEDLLAAGQFDSGFLAVARGGPGERFLAWWAGLAAEVSEAILGEDEQAGAAEQLSNLDPCHPTLARVLDPAATLFPEAERLLDDGCNASYWNLHARPLERRDGQILAGGRPLRLFRFTGFRPDRPYWLSGRGTRIRVLDNPLLAELCRSYAERLLAAGWNDPLRSQFASGELANGIPFDRRMRRLYAEATASGHDFGDIFSERGSEAFTNWLREPVAGGTEITRYLYEAYRERKDLELAYPDPLVEDSRGLAGWAWVHGRREMSLPEQLLPSPPDDHVAGMPVTVEVIGYFRDALGLGEAARLYLRALQAAGVPAGTTAVDPDLPVDGEKEAIVRYGRAEFELVDAGRDPTFNLICVNGDHLQLFRNRLGSEIFESRYSIGVWGWETDVLPPSWLESFDLVDEIWVYSRFVAANLSRLSPVPVVPVPLPVIAPEPSPEPLSLELPQGFKFLFMLDLFSTISRKNPVALIEAFKRAFKPGEGPTLVVKTMNAPHRPQAFDELRLAVADRPDIVLVDRYLDGGEKARLIEECDCYVSLHRSEGWGLTLSDAMALGKPVIATGYSGNLDFMTERNSYLVDYELTEVRQDNEVYPPGGTWADPDVDHAAELMRRVWEQPQEARARAERGRADMAHFSPDAVGAMIRGRLERLAESAAPKPSGDGRSPGRRLARTGARLDELQQRLDAVRSGAHSRGGLAGVGRRLVLRLIRPFTYHQERLDEALTAALVDTRHELERTRATLSSERARLRRLELDLRDGGGSPDEQRRSSRGSAARL